MPNCLPVNVLTVGTKENNKNKEESREQRELHENILVEMCGFFPFIQTFSGL